MSPIPHVIYFFWDRGKVLPDFAKKNIASWHKFFPDYLIREVDSTNFDINSVKVVRLAYEQKRFAYACDYIRLKTIYDNGGIYFDLDVEVIKDMREHR
jgi:mannosyltransferase OCH1-like enzyme